MFVDLSPSRFKPCNRFVDSDPSRFSTILSILSLAASTKKGQLRFEPFVEEARLSRSRHASLRQCGLPLTPPRLRLVGPNSSDDLRSVVGLSIGESVGYSHEACKERDRAREGGKAEADWGGGGGGYSLLPALSLARRISVSTSNRDNCNIRAFIAFFPYYARKFSLTVSPSWGGGGR